MTPISPSEKQLSTHSSFQGFLGLEMLAQSFISAGLIGATQLISAVAQYNQLRAIEFVNIAAAAYCLPDQVESWTCPQCLGNLTSVKMCTATSSDKTQAFVARWEDGCVISFEGTEIFASEITDLELYTLKPTPMLKKVCDNCSVHSGYLDVWASLRPCLVQNLRAIGCNEVDGSPIRVTGHSLGAGVSGIAMMHLEREGWNIAESYNFGMPRTGDDVFVANFTSTFSGKFWRLTHHKDPIVQLPPDAWGPLNWKYSHVEPEVFYDGDVNQGYKICTDEHDSNCSSKYWNFNWDLTFYDHLHYLGVQLGRLPCIMDRTIVV